MSRRYNGPPDTESLFSLKVDNLTFRTTVESLRKAFEKYGEIGDVYIPRDRYTQESRGFGFVRFYDERDAEDAIDGMDGRIMDGRELRVQLAKHPRPPNRYGGSGSRRDSGRRQRTRSLSRSRSRSYDRRGRYSNNESKRGKRYSRSASREKSKSKSH
ncbi:hypothetical protein HELRODRAFT_97732 [Helobdella robusta]|uniref:RRM domain-containing protein n=1 Tax=Helobdella robusta TaxID=6412 RepID=T1G9I7_HELRO|nr:hypothetical protein HELRODRAFT_97732 [Helobdella robusta]ESO08793.1 hypothetical protein HELRODRAFT_97732 [Helobdella robusta]